MYYVENEFNFVNQTYKLKYECNNNLTFAFSSCILCALVFNIEDKN